MAQFPTVADLTGTDAEADPGPAVLDLSDERAAAVLSALGSATARDLLQAVRDSPTYPAELAERTGTSTQNVHYHLDRLEAAGVVEVVDTAYSERGREMDVYAPTADPLVVVSGDEDDRRQLIETLSKALGAVGVLALGSVAVQGLVRRLFYPGGPTTLAGNVDQYGAAPMTNVAPPVGAVVFVAGLAVVLGWVAWRRR